MDNFVKYPRTFHLPWSLGRSSDDKVLSSIQQFINQEIIVTLKFDGENTTMYHNGIHARSLDYSFHESRSWVRNKHGEIAHLIPQDLRLCGENLFAKHSINYENLESYFMMFSAWKGDTCLAWDKTCEIASTLDIPMVPVIFKGLFNEKEIKAAFKPFEKSHEGYVIRLAREFSYKDFSKCTGKMVRANHVQTDTHWMNQALIKNQLKK